MLIKCKECGFYPIKIKRNKNALCPKCKTEIIFSLITEEEKFTYVENLNE